MNQFKKSDEFETWFKALKDLRAKTRILARIVSAEKGNFGDTEPVGHGISEMRIHYGPGYRLYYTRRREIVYRLLTGGGRGTQKRDIKKAIEMAATLEKDRP